MSARVCPSSTSITTSGNPVGSRPNALTGDSWIVDGNYGGTFDQEPRKGRAGSWMAPSDTNSTSIRWIWNYPSDSRPRLDAAIERHPHLDVVELTTRDETRRFLRDATATPEAS